MYKTIVVPVDIANADKAAVMLETARVLGGDEVNIILTNVIEEIPNYVAAQLPGRYVDAAKETAIGELTNIAKSAGLDAEIDVRSGQTSRVILEIADEKNADAIIIASHRPVLQDYLLGSTAARVVRHANCSVVVIR